MCLWQMSMLTNTFDMWSTGSKLYPSKVVYSGSFDMGVILSAETKMPITGTSNFAKNWRCQ